MSNEYVTCEICGGRYKGVMPKGGDGSALRPRKHKRKVGITTAIGGGNFVVKYNLVVCDGSYRTAKEYAGEERSSA